MAAMKFVHPEDRQMKTARDLMVDLKQLESISAAELDVELWAPHPGGPDQLQMLEVTYPAGVSSSPHAHEVDEIVVVTQGEMRFGSHVCRPGSSVMIPAFTLYSFAAGPEGVTFLNFRARADNSVLKADDLRARRGS